MVEGEEVAVGLAEQTVAPRSPRLLPYLSLPLSLIPFYRILSHFIPIFTLYDQLNSRTNSEGFVLIENLDRVPILSRRLLSLEKLEKLQPFSRWRYL